VFVIDEFGLFLYFHIVLGGVVLNLCIDNNEVAAVRVNIFLVKSLMYNYFFEVIPFL
jgi:hypothetical protein